MTTTQNPTRKPRTTKVKPAHGVSSGAARQSGTLDLCVCNDCGAEVVWALSRRTGRHYLVNVRRGYLDQRYYQGNDLHPRDCADQAAERRAAQDAEWAEQERRRVFAAEYADMQRRLNNGDITFADMDAFLDAESAARKA